MSKTHRKLLPEHLLLPEQKLPKLKPRQIKRQKQREAMAPQVLEFPQRLEAVTFKPMG